MTDEPPTGHVLSVIIFTRLFVASIALLAFAGIPYARAATDPAAWRVVQSIGEVSVSGPQLNLTKPKPGTVLPPSATIITGNNGRAILTRQSQQIVVQPNSRLELSPDSGDRTVMRQLGGVISFRVDRRNVPHFEVTTPFLAAIVKGTKFEVSVHDDHADVNVSEGKVEVRSAISRAATLVRPGTIARVSQDAPDAIRVQDRSGRTRDVTVDEGRLEGGTLRIPDLRSMAPDLKVMVEMSGGGGGGTVAATPAAGGDFDGTLALSRRAPAGVAPRLRFDRSGDVPGNKQEATLRLTNNVVGKAFMPDAKSLWGHKRKQGDGSSDFLSLAPAGGGGSGSGGNPPGHRELNSFDLTAFSNRNSFLKTHSLHVKGAIPWWEIGGGALAIIALFIVSTLRSWARKRRERDRSGSRNYY